MSENENKWESISEQNEQENLEATPSDDVQLDDATSASGVLEHPSYKALEDKLTQAEQKAHENWEQVVREQAALQNARRRHEQDLENANKYGVKKLINEMLPVVDSLEQALQADPTTLSDAEQNMRQGIELTSQLFISALAKFGVKQLNPVGETFNPEQHEAMSMQEAPEHEPNTVVVVFQKGYLLQERVIRPARVIVSKGGTAKPTETSIDEKI